MKEIIEINGIKYRKKEPKKLSKSFIKLVSMAQIFGGLKLPNNNIEEINIVEEFKLIQEKKSKLSKRQRDSVVYQFNSYYEIVTVK